VQQRDYLERMIEQLAAAVARAAGLARDGKADEAVHELDEAWTTALGMREKDALRLDDSTLRMMLGAKTDVVVTLLQARADVEASRGADALAAALRKRALLLADAR
jgi:hypothetical protein